MARALTEKINRREVIAHILAAGAGSSILPFITPKALAAADNRDLWIILGLNGGMDQTHFCDPKAIGTRSPFSASSIRKYAGIPFGPDFTRTSGQPDRYAPFWSKYARQMLVLNGINHQTNGHRTGKIVASTGNLNRGYPHIAEIIAFAHLKPSDALSFLAMGYNNSTAGLVPSSQLTVDFNADQRIVDPLGQGMLHRQEYLRLREHLHQRMRQQMQSKSLSRKHRQLLAQSIAAQKQMENISSLGQHLPGQKARDNNIHRIELIMAGFAAGLTTAASMDIGKFDSHDNNDSRQNSEMLKVMATIDFAYTLAAQKGLADRLHIAMITDFGRTAYNNNEKGKDHATTTSYMFIGKRFAALQGVVGQTNNLVQPMKLHPRTLRPDSSGLVPNAAAVHQAWRNFVGCPASISQKYPLARFSETSSPLPFFG
ncbi:MAG: DUF1501 domain-containing protein [Zetaproteobacteria bacterium]|nr:DUF1501 domain-containing protein [Zetaproteobacteria bacterium]